MEKNSRDYLALGVITLSFLAIVAISWVYIRCSCNADSGEKIFNALLPLLGTWVGTVLVFYFGKESFESASKNYEKIINKISPEVLADIPVRQVMIDKFTMVSLPIGDTRVANADIPGLLAFLDSVNKSRLPVMEDNKIKYIIYRSLLTEEIAKNRIPPLVNLDALKNSYPTIEKFGIIKETDTVAAARKLMQANNYKDVFVVDANNDVLGWLTDTQIIRYMDMKA